MGLAATGRVQLVFGALWIFFKASDDGQFDDLDTPALDILDDAPPRPSTGPRAS